MSIYRRSGTFTNVKTCVLGSDLLSHDANNAIITPPPTGRVIIVGGVIKHSALGEVRLDVQDTNSNVLVLNPEVVGEGFTMPFSEDGWLVGDLGLPTILHLDADAMVVGIINFVIWTPLPVPLT